MFNKNWIVFFFYLILVILGYKIKIVGCYVENLVKRNIFVILFSDLSVNLKIKIDYKNFKVYIFKVI